eukprot:COSAG05_NODE_6_length_45604_cov_26.489660_10_plen_158_part_00
MKYDSNGDGQFSIPEVKAIIMDLDRARDEAKNYKTIAMGASVMALIFMAAMLGLMVFAVEVSKDSRPSETGILEDNDGNTVQTGMTQNDGNNWNTAVTSLGGALNQPDNVVSSCSLARPLALLLPWALTSRGDAARLHAGHTDRRPARKGVQPHRGY